MNHRMGKRLVTSHPVSLAITGLGEIEGRLMNVSLTGAAIDCINICLVENHLPVSMELQLRQEEREERYLVNGFVVRQHGSQIGVMFMQEMFGLLHHLRSGIVSDRERRRKEA